MTSNITENRRAPATRPGSTRSTDPNPQTRSAGNSVSRPGEIHVSVVTVGDPQIGSDLRQRLVPEPGQTRSLDDETPVDADVASGLLPRRANARLTVGVRQPGVTPDGSPIGGPQNPLLRGRCRDIREDLVEQHGCVGVVVGRIRLTTTVGHVGGPPSADVDNPQNAGASDRVVDPMTWEARSLRPSDQRVEPRNRATAPRGDPTGPAAGRHSADRSPHQVCRFTRPAVRPRTPPREPTLDSSTAPWRSDGRSPRSPFADTQIRRA